MRRTRVRFYRKNSPRKSIRIQPDWPGDKIRPRLYYWRLLGASFRPIRVQGTKIRRSRRLLVIADFEDKDGQIRCAPRCGTPTALPRPTFKSLYVSRHGFSSSPSLLPSYLLSFFFFFCIERSGKVVGRFVKGREMRHVEPLQDRKLSSFFKVAQSCLWFTVNLVISEFFIINYFVHRGFQLRLRYLWSQNLFLILPKSGNFQGPAENYPGIIK